MLTLYRSGLLVVLLASLVLADAFYTSSKLGLLVRQPPGWLIEEAEGRLLVVETGRGARAHFQLLTGKDAREAWRVFAAGRPGFESVEEILATSDRLLVLARFQEGGASWTGSYLLRPHPGGFLLAASEIRSGADARLVTWANSVIDSATPVR